MVITSERALLVLGGAAAALLGTKAVSLYREEEELTEEDLDDEIAEVYLEKGPSGAARFLKRGGHAEDRDEALEMVSDFEDDNEDIVAKYEKRKARRAAREQQREAREDSRRSRTSRQSQSASSS